MTNNSQNVINCIKRRKANLINVFGGKCCICGFDKFQEGLEFHHVDPSTKEFGISSPNAVTKALSKQLDEAKKCILVCANCHRGIHSGYYTIPENWQGFYSEDYASQLLYELEQFKTQKIHYCQRCGKKISHKASYCPDCYSLLSRKIDRPSREELKKLIRQLPFTQIAQRYAVTDNAIRKWCDGYNLPRKKHDILSYSNEEWTKI